MKKKVILVMLTLVLLFGLVSIGCTSDKYQAKKALTEFLTYHKYNQWDQVWGMLHPDSQAAWDSEDEFIQTYNQSMSGLKTFELGKSEVLSSWTSRGNGKTYSNVVEIRATMVFSGESGEAEQSDTIHAVESNGSWKFFIFKK